MKLLFTYEGAGIPSNILNSTDPDLNYCYEGIAFDYGRQSIWTHGHEFGYTGELSYLQTDEKNNLVSAINELHTEANSKFAVGLTYSAPLNQYLSNAYLDNVGVLTYEYNTFTNEKFNAASTTASTHEIQYTNNTTKTVVTDVHLENGRLSYNIGFLPDLSLSDANKTASKTHTGGTADIRLTGTGQNTGETKTTYQFITGINQAANGKITYEYAGITSPGLSIGNTSGNFIIGTTVSDHQITNTYGTFGANTGVETNTSTNGTVTCTNTYISGATIDANGKLTYTYANVNHTNTGATYTSHKNEYVSAVYLDANGNYSYQYNEFANDGSTDGVLTNVHLENGRLTYNSTSLATTGSGDFLITYTIDANGHFTSIFGDFSSTKSDGNSTLSSETELSWGTHKTSNVVVTNVNLSKTGDLTYSLAYMPSLTTTSGTDSLVTGDGATKLSKNSGEGHRFISSISQDSKGKITYTYGDIYSPFEKIQNNNNARTDNQYIYQNYITESDGTYTVTNAYTAHTTLVSTGTVSGVSTVNVYSTVPTVNTDSHIAFTETTYILPTKEYVDSLMQANDALRYCGTYNPSAAENSRFSHNGSAGPAHGTTPDTSIGALYKVSAAGKFFDEDVTAGDIIISYADNASTTNGTGWHVIQTNLNLTNTGVTYTNTKNQYVSNVKLSGTGDYTYEYNTFTNEKFNAASTTASTHEIQYTNNTTKTVVTDVHLENGRLSYNIGYLPSLTVNDGSVLSIATGANATELSETSTAGHRFITGITQAANGQITYQVTDIYTPALSLGTAVTHDGGDIELIDSSHNFIDGMSLSVNDHQITLTYHYGDAKATETHLSIGNTSGNFIIGTTVNDHQITNTYGTFTNNSSVDTTDRYGVITYTYLDSTGKLTYLYRTNAVSSGTDVVATGDAATEITNSTTAGHRFLTNISEDKYGKITYTYGDFYTPQLSIGNTSGNFIIGTTVNDHQITNTYGTFGANTGVETNTSTSGTVTDTNTYISGATIDANGKLTYTYANVNHTNTGASALNADNDRRFITNVKLSPSGDFTYTYKDGEDKTATYVSNWDAGSLPTHTGMSAPQLTITPTAVSHLEQTTTIKPYTSITSRYLHFSHTAASITATEEAAKITDWSAGDFGYFKYDKATSCTAIDNTSNTSRKLYWGEFNDITGRLDLYPATGDVIVNITHTETDVIRGGYQLPSITYTHTALAKTINGGTASLTVNDTATGDDKISTIITAGSTTDYNAYGFSSFNVGSASNWSAGSHGTFSQGSLPSLNLTDITTTYLK